MDISERNSYMAKPKEGFEPSPDGGEAAGKPGHFERSSLRRLSVVRKPEDCDDDGHIRRTGEPHHIHPINAAACSLHDHSRSTQTAIQKSVIAVSDCISYIQQCAQHVCHSADS